MPRPRPLLLLVAALAPAAGVAQQREGAEEPTPLRFEARLHSKDGPIGRVVIESDTAQGVTQIYVKYDRVPYTGATLSRWNVIPGKCGQPLQPVGAGVPFENVITYASYSSGSATLPRALKPDEDYAFVLGTPSTRINDPPCGNLLRRR
jgi:hypothetical protein